MKVSDFIYYSRQTDCTSYVDIDGFHHTREEVEMFGSHYLSANSRILLSANRFLEGKTAIRRQEKERQKRELNEYLMAKLDKEIEGILK